MKTTSTASQATDEVQTAPSSAASALRSMGAILVAPALALMGGTKKARAARQASLDADLCMAAHRGDAGAISKLLAAGADAKARDEDGMTPLMLCALGARPDCVALLAPSSDPLATAANGCTALHWACDSMLDAMCAMGCATPASAQSPIMDSVRARATVCAERLMLLCDPRAKDRLGKRASDIAMEAQCLGLAETLRGIERSLDERDALSVDLVIPASRADGASRL